MSETKLPRGAHKFVEGSGTGPSSGKGVLFCQHCGHVAWNANSTDNSLRQDAAKKPCPLNA